ncbi:MAG: hypothetical protein MJZ32_12555, partial [Bacteroidaceae bacterium]|nr:hypothetical protein [Bacteroidaceae bacterium]
MKKILLSILMLLTVTAAWAGDGDGSKDHPYTGEQNATELRSKLKVGDFLAYDCVINDGIVTVYDDSLMVRIVHDCSTWAVCDPIDDTPFSIYTVGSDYCSIYSPEDRKKHTFQVTGFIELKPEEDSEDKIAVTGHYSGKYISGDGPHDVFNKSSVYVEDSISKIRVHDVAEFMKALEDYGKDSTKVIQIMNDIDMSEHKTYVSFSAQLCGYYNKRYENGDFTTDKEGNIETCTFELSGLTQPLFAECNNAKIRGLKFTEAVLSDLNKIRTNVVCNTATDTEFTDVAVIGCRYHDEAFLKGVPIIDTFIGMVTGDHAGLVASKMNNCKLKKVDVIGSTLYMRGQGVGCIAGYAERTTFEDCFVDACSTVYAEKDTKAYVGGLVGESEKCKFIRCVNMAAVCGSEKADNVGGICGKSTRCSFENCYNGGVLSQVSLDTWASTAVKMNYDIYSAMKSFYGVFSAFEKYKTCVMNVQIALSNYNNATCGLLLNENFELLQIAEAAESAASLARYTSIASAVYALYSMTFKIVVAVNDPDEMGGIAASSFGSKFNRCMNAGRIYCLDAYAGGIVGMGSVGLENSFWDVVKGEETIWVPTEINNCINIGYVQGDEQTGGIVGYLERGGRISNCLNVGTIDCNTKSTGGPIFGEVDDSSYTNCYAMAHDTEDHPDGLQDGNKVFPVSYRDVMSGLVAYKLNSLSDTASFCQDVGKQPYPTFWGSKVVKASDIRKDIDPIFKVADFNAFVNAIYNQYADIELGGDIDFGGHFFSVYNEDTPFRGSIDGKGNSLMHIGEAALSGKIDNYALIKVAEGATFKNLRLDSCNIKFKDDGAGLVYTSKHCKYDNVYLSGYTSVIARPSTGGLIWESRGDSIINCGLEGHCTVSSIPEILAIDIPITPVGGVAYKAIGSTFIDCYNRGAVRAPYSYAGGIVAECEDSKFIHCVNEGVVNIENGSYKIYLHSGAGIAAEATNSTFYRCANHGAFPDNVKYVGGIVAFGDKVTINSCLNTRNLIMLIDPDKIGAVVGGGSIIGVATNYSLVANCASAVFSDLGDPLGGITRPIMGIGENMDARSGNNYMKGYETGSGDGDWGMYATESDFDNGKVCYWLNNGIYSSENAWQQNGRELTLDGDGSLVTIDDIVNEDRSD